MFVVKEERYIQTVEIPELQKQKELLASIRNIRKPIDYNSLNEHGLRFNASLSQRKLDDELRHRRRLLD